MICVVKKMGSGPSELNESRCSIGHRVEAVLHRLKHNAWVVKLKPGTTIDGVPYNFVTIALDFNPRVFDTPGFEKASRRAESEARLYELEVYNNVISRLVEYCPFFTKPLLTSLYCTYDRLVDMLKTTDAKTLHARLNYFILHMYHGFRSLQDIHAQFAQSSSYTKAILRDGMSVPEFEEAIKKFAFTMLVTEAKQRHTYKQWLDKPYITDNDKDCIVVQVFVALYAMCKAMLMHNNLTTSSICIEKLEYPERFEFEFTTGVNVAFDTWFKVEINNFSRSTVVFMENPHEKHGSMHNFDPNRDLSVLCRSLCDDEVFKRSRMNLHTKYNPNHRATWSEPLGPFIQERLLGVCRKIAPSLKNLGAVTKHAFRLKDESFSNGFVASIKPPKNRN